MTELLGVMARLRDPDNGCPWDIKQSFETIAPYTIEEAYEVADAIQRRDMQGLKEELGDLQAIAQKMIERHPHVFGDLRFDSEADQKAHWEALKQKERESKSPQQISAVDGVALALPALTRAEKIQKRASRVGFDWSQAEDVVAKVDEEVAELRRRVGKFPVLNPWSLTTIGVRLRKLWKVETNYFLVAKMRNASMYSCSSGSDCDRCACHSTLPNGSII